MQGSFELLSAFKILEPKIKFTEEEIRKYDIKTTQNEVNGIPMSMVSFNEEVAEGYFVDVKIPARIMSYMVEKLEEMDSNETLTFQYLSLYEKLCLGKKDGNTDSSKQSEGDNK